MRIANIYSLHYMESSVKILMQNTNMSDKEVIASQTTVHNVLPARNLPNILRNSNSRTYKNNKMLDKNNTSVTSSTEDINICSDLNTTFSSVDSEKESKYNKNPSPKPHHQRKQVLNPLDIRYDIPDWNNKNMQTIDQINILQASPSHEENILIKKLKLNEKHENNKHSPLLNKKPKKIVNRKSSNKVKHPDEKPDCDSGLITALDINMIDAITMQNVNNLPSSNTQFISGSDTAYYINDSSDVGTKSNDLSNIFYHNDIYNIEQNYDINCNAVILSKSIKKIGDGLEEKSINNNTVSNCLFATDVLHTCTCTNCTSCDKDILYEDPVSSCVNSDTDMDFFTSCAHDFYNSDYYHIFGDNWLKDFDKKKIEEINIAKDDASTNSTSVTKIIENANNANVSSITEQNGSQNSQCYIDKKIQESICVESYSTGLISHSGEPMKSLKTTEHIKILDETGYLNLESVLMEENKAMSPNETYFQDTASADVSVSKSKRQPRKNKKASDIYVVQCTYCGRLFNENQFRKHFTHCSFYKEDFKCHICDKIYRYKSSLLQHLKTTHRVSNGAFEKFYTCNKCNKPYVRFRAFQRHLLLHDNDWLTCETQMITGS